MCNVSRYLCALVCAACKQLMWVVSGYIYKCVYDDIVMTIVQHLHHSKTHVVHKLLHH